jgi:hypothetical protein
MAQIGIQLDAVNGSEAEMYGVSRDSTPLATAKPSTRR